MQATVANHRTIADAARDVIRQTADAGLAAQFDRLNIVDPTTRLSTPYQLTSGISSESTPTADQAAAAVPQDTGQVFSPAMLERAAAIGISPEEAVAFGSPESLNRAIAIAVRNRMAPQQTPQQTPQQKPPEPPKPLFDFGVKGSDGNPLLEDQVINILNQFTSAIEQKFAGLEGALGHLHSRTAQESTARQMAALENAISSLPESFHSVLGKGDVLPGSAEDLARAELVSTAQGIAASRQSRGLAPLSSNKLYAMAAKATFGDQVESQTVAAAEDSVAARIRDAQGRFVSPPSARNQGVNGGINSDQRPSDPEQAKAWELSRFTDRYNRWQANGRPR